MIFEDPSHRRWRAALVMFGLFVIAAIPLAAMGVTLASILVPPNVPQPFSQRRQVRATALRASLEHDVRPVYTPEQKKRMDASAPRSAGAATSSSATRGDAMPLPAGAVVASPSRTIRLRRVARAPRRATSTSWSRTGSSCRARAAISTSASTTDSGACSGAPMRWFCRALANLPATVARRRDVAVPGRRHARALSGEEARDRLSALGAAG